MRGNPWGVEIYNLSTLFVHVIGSLPIPMCFLLQSTLSMIPGILSNKTIAIFSNFILYAIYKVRAWELHLALVRQNTVDMFGFLMHLWSCDLVHGL